MSSSIYSVVCERVSVSGIGDIQPNLHFLDALASLKTMLDIEWVTDVFKISRVQSIREYCRVLQSITEYYRVLQSVTEYYRVLQSVTEC